TTISDGRKEEDLFLNVWRQVEQVHDLGNPGDSRRASGQDSYLACAPTSRQLTEDSRNCSARARSACQSCRCFFHSHCRVITRSTASYRASQPYRMGGRKRICS